MTILTGDFTDAAAIPLRVSAGVLPGSSAEAAAPPLACHAALPEPRLAMPEDAQLYLRHVEGGESIRALARETGCHASTILRRIRRFENRRDDPLIDRAVERAGRDPMTDQDRTEMRRVLRRLAEPGAVLAVAEGMDKAIVTRADIRTAVLDRHVAETLALRGWVALVGQGRASPAMRSRRRAARP